jgi:hypothetical protein
MAKRTRDPETGQFREVEERREVYRVYPERVRTMDERPRITTNVDVELLAELEKLAAATDETKASITRDAITEYLEARRGRDVKDDTPIIRSPEHALFYSRQIVTALEEALEYDPKRHHNQPPPALRIENADYLNEIRELVAELKRLNEYLEAVAKERAVPETKFSPKRKAAPKKAAEKSAVEVSKHVNTFLNKYAAGLGTGAAALTIGTAGALLYQLGIPLDFLTKGLRR